MKKRSFLIVICVLTLLTGSFLTFGHLRRDEISDIYATQIEIDDDSRSDIWINSSDTVYNWVHRSLDFSIGVITEKETIASVVFLFSHDHQKDLRIQTDIKKLSGSDETIFTASMPYQKLAKGTWRISAYLLDSDEKKIPLKNLNITDYSMPVCTFHVR